MKKSEMEVSTLVYVIIGVIILLLLIGLYYGITAAGETIFGDLHGVVD
jgi:type II secretory pathway component PulF